MSEIGPLFSPHLIEEAALSTLMRWLPTYMSEAQAQHGVKLPEIDSWGLVDEDEDRWPEQGLPALVLVAGETEKPETYGAGWYRAPWRLAVVLVLEEATRVGARQTAQVYGAAIRACLLQRRSLGGVGRVTQWEGERSPFEATQKRTRAASENTFLVRVDEVVNWQMGPKGDTPVDDPPGPDPEVTEVNVDAEVSE